MSWVPKDFEGESSMRRKRLAGIDPGIAQSAIGIFDFVPGPTLKCLTGRVIVTKPSTKKHNISVASDDFMRWREVARVLHAMLVEYDVGMIVAESVSGSRGVKQAKHMGAVWGILASLTGVLSIPLFVVSPTGIKSGMTGHAKASKKEVEEAVIRVCPSVGRVAEDVVRAGAKNNHFYDACGAALCGLDIDSVKVWISGL